MTRPVKNLSGFIATGDSTHFGTNDLDQVNNLFTGQDQSLTDPIDMATTWKYRTQRLVLRDPTNTYSSTVVNPKISQDSTFQFNTAYDMYVFIDRDDGNKIKAREGRTGVIISSHATNADVPLQAAIDSLYNAAVFGTGDNLNIPVGEFAGSIFVGPGTYYFYTAVILKSGINITGSGPMFTKFTWPDSNLLGNHNQDMFKSLSWDSGSVLAGQQAGEVNVMLKDFQIYGNWKNNVIPTANTDPTPVVGGYQTAGVDSWGHGIAFYGRISSFDNLWIHGCPGAGIILQSPLISVGSGYPYPIFGGTGTGAYGNFPCWLTHIRSWANGRQGMLIRGGHYISDYWSYYNGEAGLETQACQYFTANGWIEGIEIFLDGANHGNQTSTTYDPLGFECRINGGSWMSDCWIEAPYGCGDNFMIGDNGFAAPSPTGYQITNAGLIYGNNILLDYVRSSGFFLGKKALNGGSIKNAYVLGVDTNDGVRTNITPMTLLANGWDIDLRFRGFVDNPTEMSGATPVPYTTNGVVIGSASFFAWGNNLKLYSYNNTTTIDPENANNENFLDITMIDNTTGTKYLLKTGSVAMNYALNPMRVEYVGPLTAPNRGHNGGLATFNGTGSQLAFQIPHYLFAAPNVLDVIPNTTGALGNYTVTADATNITITYVVAPPSGTSNIKFYWHARVTP